MNEKLMSPEQEYELAIQFTCPWHECGAIVGQRCNNEMFPQYPHIERFERAVKYYEKSGKAGIGTN